MTYALVMRTIDRSPRHCYLGETLQQLGRGGLWESPIPFSFHVLDSGSSDAAAYLAREVTPYVPEGRCELLTADQRLTNNQNGLRALRVGLATGADWVVHLEDDILGCRDLIGSIDRWLARHARANRHLFLFHAPYKQVAQAALSGIETWEYPIGAFYGNQCWAMRRADAALAADWVEQAIPRWSSGQGFDLMLKDWARETWPDVEHYLASAPSFVQHAGVESSLHFPRFHRNGSWPGEAWTYVPGKAVA